ncbi:MAG: TetR family transcriptional regulator C-terminal domain-containing protein [Rhodospirillales bacterium]
MSSTTTPPRKRLGHDERRRQILETTLICLARDGADGTSLRSVCREAGVAPSLVKHFFAGWHDLLTAAYQLLTERFMAQLAPVLTADFPTARARMDVVILHYLSTDWVGDSTVGANIALWQLARSVVDLRPHFSRFLRDRTRLLHRALGALAAEAGAALDIDELTACFILMLDGIWLEQSTNPGNIKARRATEMCWFWLDAVLHTGAPPPAARKPVAGKPAARKPTARKPAPTPRPAPHPRQGQRHVMPGRPGAPAAGDAEPAGPHRHGPQGCPAPPRTPWHACCRSIRATRRLAHRQHPGARSRPCRPRPARGRTRPHACRRGARAAGAARALPARHGPRRRSGRRGRPGSARGAPEPGTAARTRQCLHRTRQPRPALLLMQAASVQLPNDPALTTTWPPCCAISAASPKPRIG